MIVIIAMEMILATTSVVGDAVYRIRFFFVNCRLVMCGDSSAKKEGDDAYDCGCGDGNSKHTTNFLRYAQY